MLTTEDIKNLTEYQKEIFANKEDFSKLSAEVVNIKESMATKDDLKELKGMFIDLQTSVDNYAKKADAYFQEMVILSHKVERHEKWFHLIAEKLDIKLEY
jgi:uncharacterized coiled-coil DUF342 family protein